MDIQRYNRLIVMSKKVQTEVCFNIVDREHVRAQFKDVRELIVSSK
jgi:hypothetical protein